MNNHLKNLEQLIGNLKGKKILDVGAGWGNFVLACLERGYDAVGLEFDDNKIAKSRERLSTEQMVQGRAEELPFQDNSFDFINVGEVIEHVRNPKKVLQEIYRVLKPSGHVYISVHNRFGMYDTHFRLYFLGWLPRVLANSYLSVFRRHKNYKDASDLQNITEMHYFTFTQFCKITRGLGFKAIDIRESKIKSFIWIYRKILRSFYFSTFHFLLTKHEK